MTEGQEQYLVYLVYFVLSTDENFNFELIATAQNVEKEIEASKKRLEDLLKTKVVRCSWNLKPQKQKYFED